MENSAFSFKKQRTCGILSFLYIISAARPRQSTLHFNATRNDHFFVIYRNYKTIDLEAKFYKILPLVSFGRFFLFKSKSGIYQSSEIMKQLLPNKEEILVLWIKQNKSF